MSNRYALQTFPPGWAALLDDAIAYWRGQPPEAGYRRHPARRRRDAAEVVGSVIDAANRFGIP